MAITERRRYRIERKHVRSLSWVGGEVLDHAAGVAGWGLPFDGAVTSLSGTYAAAFTRLGTKGVILTAGKVMREINRSFYYAEAYLYPIPLVGWKTAARSSSIARMHTTSSKSNSSNQASG
jgi:hypothetical protein